MLQKDIEDRVLKNLDCTKAEFNSWSRKQYGIDQGVLQQFAEGVAAADKIHILGDYDCDGVCATYIMTKICSQAFKKPTDHLIPRRFSDGYGIKSKLIDMLYEKDKEDLADGKHITIVTVDNGIAGYDAIEHAKELGYHVIVTDHHELGSNKIPDAELVIDPKVPECNPFDYNGYCGAGVAYKLAENFFPNPSFKRHLRAFAALATVCDVMPLTEDNHNIVRTALKELRDGYIPKPFKYLAKASDFDMKFITEKDFGFLFGPIVNASGRLHDSGATEVLEYFLSPKEEDAVNLVAINEQRKYLVKTNYEAIKQDILSRHLDYDHSPLWYFVPDVSEGIIGILAGRITEDFGIPSIVATNTDHPGIYKASARSTSNFNIFKYLCTVPKEYFVGFGGHAGAAGLSIKADHWNDLQHLPNLRIRETMQLSDDSIPVRLNDLPRAWDIMQQYAPFGEGNPEPAFKVDVSPDKIKMIGKDQNTMLVNGWNTKLIGFRFDELSDSVKTEQPFEAYGRLSLNVFKGKASVQMIVDKLKNQDERTMNYNHNYDDDRFSR